MAMLTGVADGIIGGFKGIIYSEVTDDDGDGAEEGGGGIEVEDGNSTLEAGFEPNKAIILALELGFGLEP